MTRRGLIERHGSKQVLPRAATKERDPTRGITRKNGAAGCANSIRAGVAGGIPRQGDGVRHYRPTGITRRASSCARQSRESLFLSSRRMASFVLPETKPRRIRAVNGMRDMGKEGGGTFYGIIGTACAPTKACAADCRATTTENRGILPVRYQRTTALPRFP